MTTISGTIYDVNGDLAVGRVVRAYRRDTGAFLGEAVTGDGEAIVAATTGALLRLDAKQYSSGQTWPNQVSSPADSSAQTDYDYFLGSTSSSSSDDPTINDTGTDAAYWSFDGGDYFTHTLAAGSMPEFLRKMHHAGKAFTIELWMQWGGSSAGGICPFFDSGTSDQGGSDMSRGVMFCDLGNSIQTAGRLRFRIKQDSSAGDALAVQSDAAIPSGSVQMVAVSYAAGASSFLYRNGDYEKVGGADTFTATLSSPGSSDASNQARIGTRGDGVQRVPNGTRLYIARVYNRALSKAELDANWIATKMRFGYSDESSVPEGKYTIDCGTYTGEAQRIVLDDSGDPLLNDLIHRVIPG